ncbi:MAG: hypothetical protein KGZ83_21570 [Sulfuricella sp.]|nr:hypothetical protein [Sulfuricella sp.]
MKTLYEDYDEWRNDLDAAHAIYQDIKQEQQEQDHAYYEASNEMWVRLNEAWENYERIEASYHQSFTAF